MVNASRWDTGSSGAVREQAVLVMNKLVQLLHRHADNVSRKLSVCVSYLFIYLFI